jgi:hypothetical protein
MVEGAPLQDVSGNFLFNNKFMIEICSVQMELLFKCNEIQFQITEGMYGYGYDRETTNLSN